MCSVLLTFHDTGLWTLVPLDSRYPNVPSSRSLVGSGWGPDIALFSMNGEERMKKKILYHVSIPTSIRGWRHGVGGGGGQSPLNDFFFWGGQLRDNDDDNNPTPFWKICHNFFRSEKYVAVPPPPRDFFAGCAASRHFATPNQTPLRRPCFYLMWIARTEDFIFINRV